VEETDGHCCDAKREVETAQRRAADEPAVAQKEVLTWPPLQQHDTAIHDDERREQVSEPTTHVYELESSHKQRAVLRVDMATTARRTFSNPKSERAA
jgi:hypothetical protein